MEAQNHEKKQGDVQTFDHVLADAGESVPIQKQSGGECASSPTDSTASSDAPTLIGANGIIDGKEELTKEPLSITDKTPSRGQTEWARCARQFGAIRKRDISYRAYRAVSSSRKDTCTLSSGEAKRWSSLSSVSTLETDLATSRPSLRSHRHVCRHCKHSDDSRYFGRRKRSVCGFMERAPSDVNGHLHCTRQLGYQICLRAGRCRCMVVSCAEGNDGCRQTILVRTELTDPAISLARLHYDWQSGATLQGAITAGCSVLNVCCRPWL